APDGARPPKISIETNESSVNPSHFRPSPGPLSPKSPDPHPIHAELALARRQLFAFPFPTTTPLLSPPQSPEQVTSANRFDLPPRVAMAAASQPAVRPKSVLYIDHDVPASTNVSPSTTPTNGDSKSPLASPPDLDLAAPAGALAGAIGVLKLDPASSSNKKEMESAKADLRKGIIGETQTTLPPVHSEASEYYGGAEVWSRARTFSNQSASAPRRYLVDVEETMRIVLEQEDTDNKTQVDLAWDCFLERVQDIRHSGKLANIVKILLTGQGTYMLSNLLQELALARDFGRKSVLIDEARLAENPVDRLSRMIKNSFWSALTRRIDAEGIAVACADPKNRSQQNRSRIYIPYGEDEMADHYREM
ncbi:hypothetical protein P7C73_g5691, partial [Tremellales sp. Uapishka_1]